MASTFIDTIAGLITFLNDLPPCKGQPPSLYIDLEGNNLCRHGTLSIMTILVQPLQKTFLIDVTTLGNEAFTTRSTGGKTLKNILESKDIPKVFFDIRNDSDALSGLHGVRVDGIEDLQLFEFASRNFEKRNVNGLAKCIQNDLALSSSEQLEWQRNKNEGKRLFAPERGGSFAVFDQRPLSAEMVRYCAQDVVYMPRLRERYLNKLCDAWWLKIRDQTETRVRLSQQPGYNGKGRHMAVGPFGWGSWQPAPHERQTRTLFCPSPSKAVEVPAMAMPDQVIGTPKGISTLLGSLSVADNGLAEDNEPTEGTDLYESSAYDAYRSDDHRDSGGYRSDDAKDFTACDKECGYCGKCPY